MDKLTKISSLSRSNRELQNTVAGNRLREAKKNKEIQNSTSNCLTLTTTVTTTTTTTTTTSSSLELTPPMTPKRAVFQDAATSPIRKEETLTNNELIHENTRCVINDMNRNLTTQKNHRHWDSKTLSIFALLFMTSFSSFMLLARSILMPSKTTMYRFINSHKALDIERITNIKLIKELMLEYRQENEIDDKVIIPGVLAVDAVSLTPHITIDENGMIK